MVVTCVPGNSLPLCTQLHVGNLHHGNWRPLEARKCLHEEPAECSQVLSGFGPRPGGYCETQPSHALYMGKSYFLKETYGHRGGAGPLIF